MNAAIKVYEYIKLSLSWLPVEFYHLFICLVFVKFADGLLGVINRAWAVLGRG